MGHLCQLNACSLTLNKHGHGIRIRRSHFEKAKNRRWQRREGMYCISQFKTSHFIMMHHIWTVSKTLCVGIGRLFSDRLRRPFRGRGGRGVVAFHNKTSFSGSSVRVLSHFISLSGTFKFNSFIGVFFVSTCVFYLPMRPHSWWDVWKTAAEKKKRILDR